MRGSFFSFFQTAEEPHLDIPEFTERKIHGYISAIEKSPQRVSPRPETHCSGNVVHLCDRSKECKYNINTNNTTAVIFCCKCMFLSIGECLVWMCVRQEAVIGSSLMTARYIRPVMASSLYRGNSCLPHRGTIRG